MSDGFKIQINVKAGDELINLRADSGTEMEEIIGWATSKAPDIQAVIALLKGTQAVAANLPVANVQQDGPSWSQQGSQQSAQPAAPGPAPSCVHGARQYKDFTSKAGKHIKMWSCPAGHLPREQQCPPEWVK